MSDCVSLKFPVSQIQENQGLSVSLSVPASLLFAGMDNEVRHDGPVTTALDFTLGGSQILLQARLGGAWIVACCRCLKDHSAVYETDFEETYPLSSDHIDVTGVVRENSLLELPQRSLCSPDCKIPYGENGLEPGQPDPEPKSSPFDALKKLKEN
ncbi:MAG: hypothetical protein COB53_01050 [Elusimicrobia bacterium]|nr:MAG: hypothetical protein COB53_01050 [Elusimicrobiota bacterium]